MPDTALPLSTAANLLAQRYGDAMMQAPAVWNQVLDTLLAHRSVRGFLPDPVSDETLRTLIAAAQSASTSSNLQTWSVVAVRDPERKARLSGFSASQAHIYEAPLFLVWLADLARLERIAHDRQQAIEGTHYLEMLIMAIIDATLAAQNAVVALESLGLGTVYIGGIRNNPEKVAAELALPPMIFPVFGMCVGTPDPARPAAIKPRLPQESVLHEEQYNPDPQPDPLPDYDRRLEIFQAEQGMPPDLWTARCISRVRTPQSLTNRHRMREALGNLGFKFL